VVLSYAQGGVTLSTIIAVPAILVWCIMSGHTGIVTYRPILCTADFPLIPASLRQPERKSEACSYFH
jgi:hypothetical protein